MKGLLQTQPGWLVASAPLHGFDASMGGRCEVAMVAEDFENAQVVRARHSRCSGFRLRTRLRTSVSERLPGPDGPAVSETGDLEIHIGNFAGEAID
jgi:hypothetical protein